MTRTTRRDFLKTAAALPLIVPASAVGRDEKKAAASERIGIGVIGTGGRGRSLINMFGKQPDVQFVAVCDVDASHLKLGQEAIAKANGPKDVAAYADFRKLLEHKGVDAVIVATPDHWHALTSIAACNAGKDVYCEKPLTNSVGEGRALCDAVKKNKRVLQCGSHERSGEGRRHACELVRNLRIGKIHTVRINLPCDDAHHKRLRGMKADSDPGKLPTELDYDFWLGHTPKVPYHKDRVHFAWRFNLIYGGGEMTDRGAHVIDLAQLGLGTDDTGPVEFDAKGVQDKGSLFDAFWDYEFTNTYANGVKMIGSTKGPRGVRFEGDNGWIFIHVHAQTLEASDPAILKAEFKPGIALGRSPGHQRNFLDCVKSRQESFATAEIGHRTATICHLNNLAMKLGRKLRWDPKAEQIVGDADANKLLMPTMRGPWKL